MDINFIGEHTVPGQVGHLLALLAFVAALFSTIGYIYATNSDDPRWKRLSRIGFYLHTIGVLGVIATIFYILQAHYFEYKYVWQHSSNDLPLYYLVSSFWEGQEGSFLLWSFWHVLIGLLLIRSGGKWEAPVMSVLSLTQMSICTPAKRDGCADLPARKLSTIRKRR
jgi:cytochrome c-type biogenesis protein CcmF